MEVIHSSTLSGTLGNFVALGRCLGVAAYCTEVRRESDLFSLACSPTAGNVLVIHVDTIAAAFPESAERLGEVLRHGSRHVLLLVTDAGEATSRFLARATAGAVAAVHRTNGSEACFPAASKELARELAGHSFRRSSGPALHLDTRDESFDAVMSIGDRPSFGRLAGSGVSGHVFVWGTPGVFDMHQPLDAELEFELGVDEYLPAIVFLRSAYADACWHNPAAHAALVIDDPLLERRYGFLDFEKLLASAREHRYHVTLGFIPWNYWRTRMRDARFFRRHADVFSVCVHGNDHTKGEFASKDRRELLARALEALYRMDLHRARTGLPYEPFMVFPQERYSVEALRALADSRGFAAVVNTRRIPDDPAARSRTCGADLLLPAQDVWFGLPVIKRHYAGEGMSSFALALFLGRPAVLAVHHDSFEEGTVRIEDFVARLSALDAGVKWLPLSATMRRLNWRQRISRQHWCVRFFADVFELVHDSGEPTVYELARRVSPNATVEDVTVDGRSVAFAHDADMLRIRLDACACAVHTIAVRLATVGGPVAREATTAYRAQVAVRRVLSELRDRVLSRSATAQGVARTLAKSLRQTAD